jgi:hypothetical protein
MGIVMTAKTTSNMIGKYSGRIMRIKNSGSPKRYLVLDIYRTTEEQQRHHPADDTADIPNTITKMTFVPFDIMVCKEDSKCGKFRNGKDLTDLYMAIVVEGQERQYVKPLVPTPRLNKVSASVGPLLPQTAAIINQFKQAMIKNAEGEASIVLISESWMDVYLEEEEEQH